ncbi:oleate hydratase [Mycoplasma sp. P36-A1]|uniref:oleate hydratase n=1 Tax=Mycoplasma sp. P36-A1 TaxID=3252900 RepID=UPI003C2C4372
MKYYNGNYEAFAIPRKPDNVDDKKAYLVGSGLASLSAAVFLIRDAQMKGENITIYEETNLPGGSLDGLYYPERGFIIRGGREMEDHFECLWDMFRSIPSIEVEGISVLDEFRRLNIDDPNYSKCRIIEKNGIQAKDDGLFTLSDKALSEISKLIITSESELDNKKITDVFSKEFFESNFWLYYRTMFAFEDWHSAMEMRRYLLRFIHAIDGLPNFSVLKFTKYNQYESLVMPLIKYLNMHNVNFVYDAKVTNIWVDQFKDYKRAKTIELEQHGVATKVDLTIDDLVFVTNGSITESTTFGDHHNPAIANNDIGGSWKLWESLAAQDKEFGNPKKFYTNIPKNSWFISATFRTLDDKVIKLIEKIAKRDPLSGKIVTGGIVTVKDSNWLLSFCVHRQPHFKLQPENEITGWFYALFSDTKGNYIKKRVTECSGEEIAMELLYHLGAKESEIKTIARNSLEVIPCYLPFITSYFMPRQKGDRPLVVPNKYKNLAFIGNFAETERDTVFTTEYSVRTAMEAVYTLLNVERAVPEVYRSCYDIEILLKSTAKLLDGKKLKDVKLPLFLKMFENKALKKMEGTIIEELLEKEGLL